MKEERCIGSRNYSLFTGTVSHVAGRENKNKAITQRAVFCGNTWELTAGDGSNSSLPFHGSGIGEVRRSRSRKRSRDVVSSRNTNIFFSSAYHIFPMCSQATLSHMEKHQPTIFQLRGLTGVYRRWLTTVHLIGEILPEDITRRIFGSCKATAGEKKSWVKHGMVVFVSPSVLIARSRRDLGITYFSLSK
jgi:hypothetical protein